MPPEAGGFPARLQHLVDATTGGNVLAYARLAGISEGALRKYLKGASEPARDILVRLASAARTNVRWLATGEGPRQGEERAEAMAEPHLVQIPIFSAELSAGAGAMPFQGDRRIDVLAAPRFMVCDFWGVPAAHAVAVRVAGDSMSPTIPDGALVVLDTRIRSLDKDQAIYAVRFGDDLLLKRITRAPGGGVILYGDNPHVRELQVPREDAAGLAILGRVVGLVSRPR